MGKIQIGSRPSRQSPTPPPTPTFPPNPKTNKMRPSRRPRIDSPGEGHDWGESGIHDARVLVLVFDSINWDLRSLCATASASRKLNALAKRVLWRHACAHRAPRMVGALANGMSNGRVGGGWDALAKLLLFCCGRESSTRNIRIVRPVAGHLARASRFSKTSGRSFLRRECRGDMLYVSDPCEHPMGGAAEDLGVYRGVFRGFMGSRTRACLVGRRVALEERVRCPYCGARVWSMTGAGLVPRSAARRLGSHHGGVEYFVCVNGHLHGACWLVPLSSDEGDERGEEEVDGQDDDGDDRTVENGEERGGTLYGD